jgi:hypothetical protein
VTDHQYDNSRLQPQDVQKWIPENTGNSFWDEYAATQVAVHHKQNIHKSKGNSKEVVRLEQTISMQSQAVEERKWRTAMGVTRAV